MAGSIVDAKASVRRRIGDALAAMPPDKRAADSARLCVALRELPVWKQAASVLLFAPMAEEPDIWPLLAEALAAGKIAALPRFNAATRNYTAARVQDLRTDIVSGHIGIREPAVSCPEISLSQFSLVLVPGVAFDAHGHRLGHGKGYYDRLLAEVRGVKCGIAFEEQLTHTVPVGPADVRLDIILTPGRNLETGV